MLPMDVLRVIDAKAIEYNLPVANLAAIVDVESAGKVFATVNGQQRPLILFEPHLLDRRLQGAARDEARRLGLSSASWNKRLYGRTQADRWKQIADAAALMKRHGLDPTPAFESASYGVGQVLGLHWSSLGFTSFNQFYDAALSGAEGQVDIMLRYIVRNNLDDELRDGRWPAFFRGYNGPRWQENKYDEKIEAALAIYGGASTPADGMLRMGSKGRRVRELQALLVRAGYQVKVDGDFGPSTKDALRSFQVANGLKADGVYGPKTEQALAVLRQGAEDKPGAQPVTDIGGVKEGLGGAAVGVGIEMAKNSVDQATVQLHQIEVVSPYIDWVLTGLSVAAAVLAIAGLVWAVKSWMASKRTVEV